MRRKLRMAMIGGGKDAFIGGVHRIALNMAGPLIVFIPQPLKGLFAFGYFK